MPEDSRPSDLSPQYHSKRTVFRFDPTVSSGTLIQIAVLLGGGVIAYGTYQSDRTETKLAVDALRASAVEEKAATKGSLAELRTDVKDVQRVLGQISTTLAVSEARQQSKPAGGR
jgi:uncharacterized protein HemX